MISAHFLFLLLTGKTAQVVTFLSGVKQSYSTGEGILIVCPATLLGHWVRELHTWYPPLRVVVFHESGEGIAQAKGKTDSVVEHRRCGFVSHVCDILMCM